MAQTVTQLIDRGTYWSISYDDGGHDEVPKDPAQLDTAAANARLIGQTALADKLQGWANHIRKDGKPVDVPMGTGKMLALVGLGGLAAWFLIFRKA